MINILLTLDFKLFVRNVLRQYLSLVMRLPTVISEVCQSTKINDY